MSTCCFCLRERRRCCRARELGDELGPTESAHTSGAPGNGSGQTNPRRSGSDLAEQQSGSLDARRGSWPSRIRCGSHGPAAAGGDDETGQHKRAIAPRLMIPWRGLGRERKPERQGNQPPLGCKGGPRRRSSPSQQAQLNYQPTRRRAHELSRWPARRMGLPPPSSRPFLSLFLFLYSFPFPHLAVLVHWRPSISVRLVAVLAGGISIGTTPRGLTQTHSADRLTERATHQVNQISPTASPFYLSYARRR